jgi:bifunctional DNase/RNase
MSEGDKTIQMELRGLMLDPNSNVPIVILQDAEGALFLPIWIGVFEANAIALRIEGVKPPRPLTHDLLHAVLGHLDAEVERVEICSLKENTFYALIHVRRNGEITQVDARPSDAIALALRAEAPIFVRWSVLEQAKAIDLATDLDDEERLKKWLEQMKPEDFGKYTM